MLTWLSPLWLLGLLSLFEPVGASIAAFILFDETPGPLALLGMALVLVAVGTSVLYRTRRPDEIIAAD